MLRVASFEITDDKGINALLDQYRLAAGAHIFVSDGKLCVPYEDGQPDTPAQQIIALQEQKNTMLRERDLHVHSKAVNKVQIEDAEKLIAEIEPTYLTKPNDKATEEKYKKAQQKRDELLNLQLQIDAEIRRIDINVAEFDRSIAELNK